MRAASIRDGLTLIASILITIGCFQVSFALGLIFAGLTFAAISVAWSLNRDS